MKKVLSCVLFILFSFFVSSDVYAEEDWKISSYTSDLTISSDGVVHIKENILVNFSGVSHHGIYRDIPFIYHLENGKKVYSLLDVDNILQDGDAALYKRSYEGDYKHLVIGDEKRLLSGVHTYQISYHLVGVLQSFSDHDELYWDITGNGWDVPIERVFSSVSLPSGSITQHSCYQGVFSSQELCDVSSQGEQRSIFSSTRVLLPYEGMTIVVGFPKGTVPIRVVTTSEATGFPTLILSSCIALLGSLGVLWWWWRHGKEPSLGSLVAWYEPPKGLLPAEMGVIMDERADTLDVTATIIHLAVRGYLTIKEIPKTWLFGTVDYLLVKKDHDVSGLRSYELTLYKRLFSSGDTVRMSDLKESFYVSLAIVKASLYADVVKRGVFSRDPEKTKGTYMLLSLVLLSFGVLMVVGGFHMLFSPLSSVGVGVCTTGLSMLILSRSFSKRTKKGHALWTECAGFALFMGKVETYKQRVLERENFFSDMLPYAIVLGLTEKFAQAWADMGASSPHPTWYIGSQPFQPVFFSHQIGSFSQSMSSAIASQPAKNSFASSGSGFSGGSSGGGFGGGGGGSW